MTVDTPEFGAPEPDDNRFMLDLTAEAEEVESFDVRLPGGTLTFPAKMDDWTGESFNLMTEGKFRDAMLATVGSDPESAELVRSLTLGQINKIMDHVVSVSGVSPGESSGSAKSSRSTGTKRKRTS